MEWKPFMRNTLWQLNRSNAGQVLDTHTPPPPNGISVSASQSSLAPYFADASKLHQSFDSLFPHQRSQKTVQFNIFTTGLAFCQSPMYGASIADLFAIWRGGDGSFSEGSIKNWLSIVQLLLGRCQRDRTFVKYRFRRNWNGCNQGRNTFLYL